MQDDSRKQNSLDTLRRIAIAMAHGNGDPILADVHILSESTFQGKEKSKEELDNRNPVTIQEDGGHYFTHVRMDGRGQLNIIWTNGVEITYKFLIPEKYIDENQSSIDEPSHTKPPTIHLDKPQQQLSDLQEAIQKIRKVDSNYPTSISKIPGFPFDDFRSMRSLIDKGRFVISRFSFHQDLTLLELVSPRSMPIYYTAVFATYLIPILSIILALTMSKLFWFGLLYFFVGSRVTTNIWKSSITKSAYRSEDAFCLLFFTSKIHLYDLRLSRSYEWNQLQKMG